MEATKAKLEHLYPVLSLRRVVWVSRAPSAGAETGFAAGLRLFSAQPPAGWKGPPKRARSEEDTEKEDTEKEDTEKEDTEKEAPSSSPSTAPSSAPSSSPSSVPSSSPSTAPSSAPSSSPSSAPSSSPSSAPSSAPSSKQYNPAAHKRRRHMTDEEKTQHDAKQAEEAEQAKAEKRAAKAASKKAEKTAPPESAESPFAAVEVDRCFNVYTNESKLLQLGLASQGAVDASKDQFYGAFFASLRWKLEKEAEAEAEAI